MKSRLITGIIIACILFLAVVANEPKKVINQTTVMITCPKQTIQCVKTRQLPPTGALSTNQ